MNKHQAVPPKVQLSMPAQSFKHKPKPSGESSGAIAFIARLMTFGGALLLTVYAGREMVFIVNQGAVTWLQWAMVSLFVLTFVWIAVAACAAISGALLPVPRPKANVDTSKHRKTVLLMPVYNEDAANVCSALQAMGESLFSASYHNEFEIFIISDTNSPNMYVKETAAALHLQQQLSAKIPVWYRRRTNNTAKKAGNVHDFVTQWGGRYESMIVLDADSLLSANTLITMRNEMVADENSGIIQTLPTLYRGSTLFARMQQYAGAVYGPIVARGVSVWQGNDGNYWGHNAIIRIHAFASSAGLPTIDGVKPFAGDILSHDFVEAALMRRAGWSVKMLPTVPGSWEESPPTLTEVATRDRRWAQGNIQHLAVLKARGLRWPNRFHMLTGVMSYAASPIWMALVMVGIALSIQIQNSTISYFSDHLTLLPTWPVFDNERMLRLFVFTMFVLVLPKVIGVVSALFSPITRKQLGGINIFVGACIELVLSILYAPIFMLIHCKHVYDIARGKDSGWSAQTREHGQTDWLGLTQQHLAHTLIGIATTLTLYRYATDLIVWLAPALFGLICSIPLSALSGNTGLAIWLAKHKILSIPEEVTPPDIVVLRQQLVSTYQTLLAPVSFEGILQDSSKRLEHFTMVTVPTHKKGTPDVHKLVVEQKLRDASTTDELLQWLSKPEKMALLSYPELLATFTSPSKKPN